MHIRVLKGVLSTYAYYVIYIVKVKQFRNRPGVAQRVRGFHDIRHVKVVRLPVSRTGRLYPQESS
jgi:hypothetical protein